MWKLFENLPVNSIPSEEWSKLIDKMFIHDSIDGCLVKYMNEHHLYGLLWITNQW